MTKRKVTTDELRAMWKSPRTLPDPATLDTTLCWYPVVWDYETEYNKRQLTRLRREKILLRAALKDVLDIWQCWHGYQPRWSRGILNKTEDK